MDSQQAMTLCLDREVTSIRHSVTTGLMLLRKAKHIDDSFEPCLILLSIGFEKLLKLSLGLSVYAETREWVSNKELRDAGHLILTSYGKNSLAIFAKVRPWLQTLAISKPRLPS